jgi:hypothetical protein
MSCWCGRQVFWTLLLGTTCTVWMWLFHWRLIDAILFTSHIIHQSYYSPAILFTSHIIHQPYYSPVILFTSHIIHQPYYSPVILFTSHILPQPYYSPATLFTCHIIHQSYYSPVMLFTSLMPEVYIIKYINVVLIKYIYLLNIILIVACVNVGAVEA